MATLIDWDAVSASLAAGLDISTLTSDYGLPRNLRGKRSIIRALLHWFREQQALCADPFITAHSNSEVFKAAVYAIGSNSRDWTTFLSTEPDLRSLLCGYDPALAVANGLTSSALKPYFPGLTGPNDCKAVCNWANLLNSFSKNHLNYNDFILAVAGIFQSGLSGRSISPPPYGLPELTICLAGYFSDPLKRWSGRSQLDKKYCSNSLFPAGSYKWPGMGFPLAIEFLRNLGWPGFKPDRHIIRLFNNWFAHKGTLASDVNRIAALVGRRNKSLRDYIHYALLGICLAPNPDKMPLSFADNLLWLLGSQIATKTAGPNRKKYHRDGCQKLPAPFKNTKIFDCCGVNWTASVQNILQDMTLWELNNFPALDREQITFRLQSLGSIILVPDSFLREIRRICPGQSDLSSIWKELSNIIETVRMEQKNPVQAVHHGEEAKQFAEDYYAKDFPEAEHHVPENKVLDLFPYGPNPLQLGADTTGEDAGSIDPVQAGDECGNITVEYYGMYVPSLKDWLAASRGKGAALIDEKVLPCLVELNCEQDRMNKAAIFLCPENIAKMPGRIASQMNDYLENITLPDGSTPLMHCLRNILLHETGHHVYPLTACHQGCRELLSECMANWFVYQCSDGWEQDILKALSETQPVQYRVYQGLVMLLREHTGLIEKTAFSSRPGDCALDRLPIGTGFNISAGLEGTISRWLIQHLQVLCR